MIKRVRLSWRVWERHPRRSNKQFHHKLLIKDNDDDLFHYVTEWKAIFTVLSPSVKRPFVRIFWDLFAFVSLMLKKLFLAQAFAFL